MFPYWATLDSTAGAAAAMSFNAVTTLHERARAQFHEAVPHSRLVYIPGARHYVFLTHPGEVEHTMLEFLLSPVTDS
jgi:pimeloyl-ACP methyl ester carboxylesterase